MRNALETQALSYLYEDGTRALDGISLQACLLYTSVPETQRNFRGDAYFPLEQNTDR